MRIAVCDDDLEVQKQFVSAVNEWDDTQKVELFQDGSSFLRTAREFPTYDIAFLDIYLPDKNGIDIAKNLQEISPQTKIVFITTSDEFAVEAFSLYALHYLVKPITKDGIFEAFRRLTNTTVKKEDKITLSSGSTTYTVSLDQIYLLESDNHMVNVSLSDGRHLKIRSTFNQLEKKMDKNFLKINRGIIVNMDYIEQMSKNTCTLRSGIRLPIAVRQSSKIRSAYDDYVFDQLTERDNSWEK